MKIFCHLHESTFKLIRGQQVVCDVGQEIFAEDFPNDDWWCFCCGCQTFWKFNDFATREPSAFTRCVACGRRVVKSDGAKKEASLAFYLCHGCKTLSFQTKDVAKGAVYTLQPLTLAGFRCPACSMATRSEASQHECKTLGVSLMTSREECPLCGERFQPHQRKTVVPKTKTVLKEVETKPPTGSRPAVQERRLPSEGQRNEDLQKAVPATLSQRAASLRSGQQKKDNVSITPALPRYLIENKPAAQAASRDLSRQLGLVWGIAGTVFIVVAVFVLFFNSKGQTPPDKATVSGETQPLPEASVQSPTGMVFVNGGEFLMGNDAGDEFERPQHKVKINAFFLDKYEVPCEEYGRFIGATGHRSPPRWSGNQYPPNSARLPIAGVDWDDANAYCQWAGKRLPTEAEWEYAARGTDARRYPWGNDWRENAANADQSSQKKIMNVGSFPAGASPFGTFDLIGNVWEWTADTVKAYPGGRLPETLGEEYKVIRGGSWNEDRQQGASATYRGYLPARGGKDYNLTGCRCAKDRK
jgi:formylglycine-generating enzyme required for sulfatase activity